MKGYFSFLLENTFENKFNFYLLAVIIASIIPSIVFMDYLILISLIIIFIVKTIIDCQSIFRLNGVVYTQYRLEKETEIKDREAINFKNTINNIFERHFKKTEFKEIFDQKIFTVIDLVNELNKKNLHGVIKLRVQSLINDSLKIYCVNIESASKMIQAHTADIDFSEEIKVLLEQNNIIMIKLKEFITKLIMLNNSTEEFKKLINTFEYNLVSLDIIKNVRKDKE